MKRTPKKRKYTPERVEEIRKKLEDWIQTSNVLWLGKFAQDNGFHRQRFEEFTAENENFAETFMLAKQAQENWVVLGAISKKFDCGMAAFALKNVAGWRDQNVLIDNSKTYVQVYRPEPYTSQEVASASREITRNV